MNIIKKIRRAFSYLYRNGITPRWYSIRDRKILAQNRALKDKYAGKRCFVIGGGPSTNQIDLGRLKNEYTFVCSEFDRNPQFEKLKPKFYLLSDSIYYTESDIEYWPKRFRAKEKSVDPSVTTMLLNLGAKPMVEKYNLFKQHYVYYIGTQGIFTDNIPFNINIDKYVPLPKNSILLCLIAAVWMGFKEIYLLGCEHNFLSFNIGYGKSLVYNHSYEDEISKLDPTNDEVLKKYVSPRDLKLTYEKNVAHVLQLLKNYRFFYQKVKMKHPGIKIFNATPNSFLDVFPMINFEDIKL